MKVFKTVKLYIGGKFPRTESGRSYTETVHGTDKVYANLCQASRKDFRNSVEAATEAQAGWAGQTAYLRGQILYRMAEMTEGKRLEFVETFKEVLGKSEKEANTMVDEAIDAFVYYAGFTDKYQHLVGTVNPVSGPFMNYSVPEPVGVVTLISDEKFNFQKLVIDLCGIILSGNTVVALLPKECGSVLAPLAEVFATSDLPGGVINLLTGYADELVPHMGPHMEVKSISCQTSNKDVFASVREAGVDNMKRVVPLRSGELSLDPIMDFVEYKTVWHPLGI